MDKMHNLKAGTTEYKNMFNKLNYKQLKVNVKPFIFTLIDNYCKSNNISKARFIVAACKYCIDNNINLTATDSRAEDK